MTERLGENNEPILEFVHPDLDNENELQTKLMDCILRGREMMHGKYQTEADARARAAAFDQRHQELITNVAEAGQMLLQVSGDGVLTSTTRTTSTEEGEIIIKVLHDKPLAPLDRFDTKTVYFECVKTVIAKDVQSGDWVLRPNIMCADSQSKRWQTTSKEYDIVLSEFAETSRVIVRCNSDNVEMDVIKLIENQKKVDAIQNLSDDPNLLRGLINDIIILDSEFNKVDPYDYVALRNIKSLRALGQKGINCMMDNKVQIHKVNEAIEAVIGEKRSLKVRGDVYYLDGDDTILPRGETTAVGSMLTIVGEVPSINPLAGPTFAIAAGSENGTYYVPFTSTTSVEF